MTTISPELQKQIEQEAIKGQHTYPGTDYGYGFNKGYDSGYKISGERYALKWEQAEAMIEKMAKVLQDIVNTVSMDGYVLKKKAAQALADFNNYKIGKDGTREEATGSV